MRATAGKVYCAARRKCHNACAPERRCGNQFSRLISRSIPLTAPLLLSWATWSVMRRQYHSLLSSMRTLPGRAAASGRYGPALLFARGIDTPARPRPQRRTLSLGFGQLEIHLLLWRAKFEYWIPNNPEHCVVYMADEKKHGLGFPPKTDDAVETVLQELRKRWLK